MTSSKAVFATAAAFLGIAAISTSTSPAGAAPLGAPPPNIAQFLPANYRVTGLTDVDLDGSRFDQVAVTAVGTPTAGGQGGPSFAPSTVLLLAWDSIGHRWTDVFDAAKQSSYQTSPQIGSPGPGLVGLGETGPAVAVIHDEPGHRADLVYWDMSVAGNSGSLLIGIVHFANQIADLVWDTQQDLAHTQLSTPEPVVTGVSPHQRLKISAPWETADDSRSNAVRLYSYVVGVTSTFGDGYPNYGVLTENRPWVGVGIAPGTSWCPACSHKLNDATGEVDYVYPGSPARSVLRRGDVIEGVRGAQLPKYSKGLLGPAVIDEVARFYPHENISLNIEREGRQIVVRLTLGQWSYNEGDFNQVDQQLGVYLVPM